MSKENSPRHWSRVDKTAVGAVGFTIFVYGIASYRDWKLDHPEISTPPLFIQNFPSTTPDLIPFVYSGATPGENVPKTLFEEGFAMIAKDVNGDDKQVVVNQVAACDRLLGQGLIFSSEKNDCLTVLLGGDPVPEFDENNMYTGYEVVNGFSRSLETASVVGPFTINIPLQRGLDGSFYVRIGNSLVSPEQVNLAIQATRGEDINPKLPSGALNIGFSAMGIMLILAAASYFINNRFKK